MAATTVDTIARAAEVMEEATNAFVLNAYAVEGLEALIEAGWTITPPLEPHPALEDHPDWDLAERRADDRWIEMKEGGL
jgi:hypothetical protein